jgi:hypothetical protein
MILSELATPHARRKEFSACRVWLADAMTVAAKIQLKRAEHDRKPPLHRAANG